MIEIYTDGSCLPNKRGSWAYVIVQEGQVVEERCGFQRKTSSQAMEYRAAIEALATVAMHLPVKLISDSKIMIDAITMLAPRWEALNWKKETGRPIPYEKEVRSLYQSSQSRHIEWSWIKGHNGHFYNDRCDELCIQARNAFKTLETVEGSR